MPRPSRGPSDEFRPRAHLVAVLAGCALLMPALTTGCSTSPEHPGLSPMDKVARLFAIDFGSRAAARRERGLRRVFDIPSAELARLPAMRALAEAAPPRVVARIDRLPPAIRSAALAEAERSLALTSPSPLVIEQLPTPSSIAASTARDLERLGYLLGLERRPLPEIDDRRHRVDPRDDHPEKTLWERLARRIFP